MNEHAKLPPTPPPPQPTSSLKQFDILIGEWNTVGTHPALPSTARGHSSFEWLMEGALFVWHFDWEPGGPPSALGVIGHDDIEGLRRQAEESLEGRFDLRAFHDESLRHGALPLSTATLVIERWIEGR